MLGSFRVFLGVLVGWRRGNEVARFNRDEGCEEEANEVHEVGAHLNREQALVEPRSAVPSKDCVGLSGYDNIFGCWHVSEEGEMQARGFYARLHRTPRLGRKAFVLRCPMTCPTPPSPGCFYVGGILLASGPRSICELGLLLIQSSPEELFFEAHAATVPEWFGVSEKA